MLPGGLLAAVSWRRVGVPRCQFRNDGVDSSLPGQALVVVAVSLVCSQQDLQNVVELADRGYVGGHWGGNILECYPLPHIEVVIVWRCTCTIVRQGVQLYIKNSYVVNIQSGRENNLGRE